MNKFLRGNIIELNKLKQKAPQDTSKANKRRIDEIIKLYIDRKNSNIAAAENLIKGLTSPNKKVYDKAFQKYKHNIQKFQESKPLNQRVSEARTQKESEGKEYKKRGVRKKSNTYLVSFLLYSIRSPKNEKVKPAFQHNGRSYYLDSFDIRSATITAPDFSKDIIGKRVFRYVTDQDYLRGQSEEIDASENPEFKNLLTLLGKDEAFDELIVWLQQYYDN